MLVSPYRNPVRDQQYEAQIEFHQLGSKERALQKGLKRHTNRVQCYKQAYIQKTISKTNLRKRTKYGQDHQHTTIHNPRQWIFFTDEAHIDPSSASQGDILREQGTRYNTENIQQRPEKTGVKLHVARWCNWHTKCKKLEF